MSEFKFACPICGQHITADSKDAGSKISCPTCFRKIVVPQGSTESKFVISASEANKPRPTPTTIPDLGPIEKTSDKTPVPIGLIVGLVAVCAVGATVFALRHTLFHSKPRADAPVVNNGETNSSDTSTQVQVRPDYTGTNLWSMDLTNVTIPDGALAGSLHHQAFEVERATLQGSNLTLRIGTKGSVELGLNIYFFNRQPEELGGKSAVVKPTDSTAPKVVLHWKDHERRSETFRDGYAMKIEFEPVSGNALPGKLFISLPDDSKSWVAGTFRAEIRRPSQPKPKPGPQSSQTQTQ